MLLVEDARAAREVSISLAPDSPSVYLDYNATTPLDPSVLEAMLPYLTTTFGNASSSHAWGRKAAFGVEEARRQVSALLGASPQEIIYTSGATESNNLVLKGVRSRRGCERVQVVSSVAEHPAVLEPLRWLQAQGMLDLTLIPVQSDGTTDAVAVREALNEHTTLVSFMLANNETGVLTDMKAISAAAREVGALVHCDATQALGRLPIDVDSLDVDFLSASGHKVYGPKGVGILYTRRRVTSRLSALQHGGGQERSLRNGTLNTPGIVGMGAAAFRAMELLAEDAARMLTQRDLLHSLLADSVPGLTLNGSHSSRLPNTLNVRLPGAESDAVLAGLHDVATSSGSACASSHQAASPVLRAMGLSEDEAGESLRLSVGRFTTESEIRFAARRVAEVYATVVSRSAIRKDRQP